MQNSAIKTLLSGSLLRGWLQRPILFVAFFFTLLTASAQQNKVIGSLQIQSPVPTNWSGFTTTSVPSRMTLNLTLIDGEGGSTSSVRLKMYIEKGNTLIATSSAVVNAPSIGLTLNVLKPLYDVDLAPYFQFLNLQGMSQSQYDRQLEDGLYRISFEVYSATTNERLSASISQNFFISLNSPPALSQPSNGEQITNAANNITFQWASRASTSVSSSTAKYKLTAVEIPTGTTDLASLFNTAIPALNQIVSYDNNSLSVPTTSFTVGKSYAWRLQVLAIARASETPHPDFKNNAYSDIFTFNYTTNSNCPAPTNLQLVAKASDMVAVSWLPSNLHYSYRVAYRKKDPSAIWQWVELPTTNAALNLTGLEASRIYEVRVGGICSADNIVFCPPQDITTLAAGNIAGLNCTDPDLSEPTGTTVMSLSINDVIKAGDFDVTLVKVNGGNGIFSGQGWIKVPWMLDTKLKVVFSDITVVDVNGTKTLKSGTIETVYDPNSTNIADIDSAIADIVKILNELEKLLNELLARLNSGSNMTESERIAYINRINSITGGSNGGLRSLVSPDFFKKLEDLKSMLKNSGQLDRDLIQSNLTNIRGAKNNKSIQDEYDKCFSWVNTSNWIKTNKGNTVNYKYTDFFVQCETVVDNGDPIVFITNINQVDVISPEGVTRKITIMGEYNTREGLVQIDVPCIKIPMDIGDGKLYFNFDIYYAETTNFIKENRALRIYVNSFEDYRDLLSLFGYTFSESAKIWYIGRFKEFLNQPTVSSDCNQLDFVYEEMPLFVARGIGNDNLGDEKLFAHLQTIANCRIDNWGTNENKAVYNLLSGYKDPNWWINKIKTNPDFFINLLQRFNDEYRIKIANIFSEICANNWTQTTQPPVVTITPFDLDAGNEHGPYITVGTTFGKLNTGFRFARKYYYFERWSISPTETAEKDGFDTDIISPVTAQINDKDDVYLPAFVAYSLLKKTAADEKWQDIVDRVNLLTPEAGGARFRWLNSLESKKKWTWNELAKERGLARIGSSSGLSVEKFTEECVSKMASVMVRGEKGERLILGIDESVKLGELFPTMDGILDIHVHGDFRDGAFMAVENDFSDFKTAYSPEHLAYIINTKYPNIRGIRIFACNGVESGAQRIFDLTNKPVLTSFRGNIYVQQNGYMYMNTGELKLINTHQ